MDDDTTCDRGATAIVIIGEDRICEGQSTGRIAGIVLTVIILVAFAIVPAEVQPARRAGGNIVDLLLRILPHVADVEITRGGIEADAPGIADAERPNLVGATGGNEGIVGRNRIILAVIARKIIAVDINAQDLAEQRILVLSILTRIAAAAAVANAEIEITIGPERDRAAIVVSEIGMGNGQQSLGEFRTRRIAIDAAIFADLDVAVAIGHVDEEAAVARIVGMKGHAEHTALAATAYLAIGDMEEGRFLAALGVDAKDLAGILSERIDEAVVTACKCGLHGTESDIGDLLCLDEAGRSLAVDLAVAVDHIVAFAAEHRISAIAGGKRVSATKSVQRVGAAECDQEVGIIGTVECFGFVGTVAIGHTSPPSHRWPSGSAGRRMTLPLWQRQGMRQRFGRDQKEEAACGYDAGGPEGSRMQLSGAMMHHQPVDGGIHLFSRWKQLIVEVHDVVFDRDELQLAVFGYGDPDRFPGILDDLFVHNKNFPCASAKRWRQMT